MKTRRGLHTVVGAVIFTAVMISALSYVSYSLDLIGNFSETVIVEDSRQREKDIESFQITTIGVTSANKLNATIKNTGNIPVTLKNLWIDDQNVADDTKKFPIDITISPGAIANIGPSLSFTMSPTAGYDMKLVTQRGNTESFFVNSGTTQRLYYQVQVLPETIPSGFSATVLLNVVNNMSSNSIMYNITPEMTAVATVGDPTITLKQSAVPALYPSLAPGDVAVFKYVYDISGDVDDKVEFTGNVLNGISGNNAKATTTIKQVEEATTAITALGTSPTDVSRRDILYFHGETTYTPAGQYRMAATAPDQAGVTVTPTLATSRKFITANTTSITTVGAGVYNASLSYYSDPVPTGTSIPDPYMAYFFSCDNCGDSDNTVEMMDVFSNQLDKEPSGNYPVWFSSGGPDNAPYYNFTTSANTDKLRNSTNWSSGDIEPDDQPDTFITWARIPPTSDTYMPIIRFGDEDVSEDELEIAVGDGTAGNTGKIVFYYTHSTDADSTKCVSDFRYDTYTWIHIAAVIPSEDDCQLYINGVMEDEQLISTSGSTIDLANFFIGWNGANSGTAGDFRGDVAQFMYWDDDELTATQIRDLYYTNYGTNATRAHFKLERTSAAGTVLGTLVDKADYQLNFFDPSRKSTSSVRYDFDDSDATDGKYSQKNYTSSLIPQTTFGQNERLQLTISWDSDTQNLPLNIRFDDNSVVTFPTFPSLLQTPSATPVWPSYIIIDNDNQPTFYVFNEGPNGAFFQYHNVRLVLTNTKTTSYAGLIDDINGTALSEDADSLFIPDNYYAQMLFDVPRNYPNTAGSGTLVPAGSYNGTIFMGGYDEVGKSVFKAVDLGVVHVVE